MPAFRLKSMLSGAFAAIALAITVQPGAAYTPEEQQACTPDAMRLCGEFVPNVDAVTACMIQKKSQLSPQCRVYFRPGPEPGMAAGQPVNLKPKKAAAKPAVKKTVKKKKPRSDDD